MKLNPDCIRDVMLEIEKRHKVTIDDENNAVFEMLWVDELYKALPKHSKEDVFYTLYNLDQAGYVSISTDEGDDAITMCVVNYMTYSGHEFLEKIRDSKAWKHIKGAGSAVGNFSLSLINQVANGVATAFINEYLAKCGIGS